MGFLLGNKSFARVRGTKYRLLNVKSGDQRFTETTGKKAREITGNDFNNIVTLGNSYVKLFAKDNQVEKATVFRPKNWVPNEPSFHRQAARYLSV